MIVGLPWVIVKSLFLSTGSNFIQTTGKSLAYWTEHFISTVPPISVTISGWVINEIVGLLSWAKVSEVKKATKSHEMSDVHRIFLFKNSHSLWAKSSCFVATSFSKTTKIHTWRCHNELKLKKKKCYLKFVCLNGCSVCLKGWNQRFLKKILTPLAGTFGEPLHSKFFKKHWF